MFFCISCIFGIFCIVSKDFCIHKNIWRRKYKIVSNMVINIVSVWPLCVRESADKPLPLSGLLVISFCMNHDTIDDDDDEDAIIHLNVKQHICCAFLRLC